MKVEIRILLLSTIFSSLLYVGSKQGDSKSTYYEVSEYLKYFVRSEMKQASKFGIIESSSINKLSLKSNHEIGPRQSFFKLKKSSIYSHCTIYPFFQPILVSVIYLLDLMNKTALLESPEILKLYDAVQWTYYMLYLKYSHEYPDAVFNDTIESVQNPLLLKKKANEEDLDFINFALSYAKLIPTATTTNKIINQLRVLLKLENVKVDYLISNMHKVISEKLNLLFPELDSSVFVNSSTEEEAYLLLKYILSEGKQLTRAKWSVFFNSIENSVANDYLTQLDETRKYVSSCMYSSPMLTLLEESESNFNLNIDYNEFGIDVDSLVAIDSKQNLTLQSLKLKVEDKLFFRFGDISEDLHYENEEIFYEIPSTNIFTPTKLAAFKKYLSSVNQFNTGDYVLQPYSLNATLLSLLRISLISEESDPNIILYQLLKQEPFNASNEVKALKKYLAILKSKECKAKTSDIFREIVQIRKGLELNSKQLKQTLRLTELQTCKNILASAFINLSIINKNKMLALESFKSSLRSEVSKLKKQLTSK